MILQEILLERVRDILRENLKDITNPVRSIRITNDERVPAYSGEEFIGIYNAVYTNKYRPEAVERRDIYEFTIGITRRTLGIPTDSTAETIYSQDEDLIRRDKSNMLKRAYQIVELLDNDWNIVKEVGTHKSLDKPVLASTPLGVTDMGEVEEVDSTHFHTTKDTDNPSGLLLEIQFRGLETYYSKIG